jgi:GTPase
MQKTNFLIASIIPHNLSEKESFENIKELIFLVESYGGKVEEIVLQKREVHDKGMYLGSGKIDEITELIKEKKINVVVLNAIVVPGQIYDMVTTFQKVNPEIEVWDRVDLILKIFSKRAFTAEAKLQIELAAMRHMGPRIYGMGLEMSRQGGGIGTRGIGETNTERMKRHWRDEIKRTKARLSKILKVREEQMKKRKEVPLKTVSLVGYTNAGKTSLFNLLTKKKKEAKDELFATLESYTGKMYMPSLKQEVLISDTIGFIRDLPPELIDAFRSTLLESINADLLLHIIDFSDPDMQRKIDVVNRTLKELGAENKKILYVYNKTDLIEEKVKLQKNSVAISVHKKTGVFNLMGMIEYSL